MTEETPQSETQPAAEAEPPAPAVENASPEDASPEDASPEAAATDAAEEAAAPKKPKGPIRFGMLVPAAMIVFPWLISIVSASQQAKGSSKRSIDRPVPPGEGDFEL